jgi:hypothetical protein
MPLGPEDINTDWPTLLDINKKHPERLKDATKEYIKRRQQEEELNRLREERGMPRLQRPLDEQDTTLHEGEMRA